MSLLYPLFLAGFAAVALPIVFHMIRRAPSGRTVLRPKSGGAHR